MKQLYQKRYAYVLFSVIILSLSVFPGQTQIVEQSEETTTLSLLRVEHYLYIDILESASETTIDFVFPVQYDHQQPLVMEIATDTTPHLMEYRITNDTNPPNKRIQFTLRNIDAGSQELLHFHYWVLVEHHDYSDLPNEQSFPSKVDLPTNTTTWLTSSDVVQKDHVLIQRKARQLRGNSDNMIEYTQKIAPFVKNHRYLLFLLQLHGKMFFHQDAVTTLLINGEVVGRSHLALALCRAESIPARVLLVHNDQGFWTQMHYMAEYYVPEYGWVLLDPTKGETPYDNHRQVINRICFPGDENNTKRDYIFPLMTGEERWMWYNESVLQPYFVDCEEGSKSQMFTEYTWENDTSNQQYIQLYASFIFKWYQHFLKEDLSIYNQQLLAQAIEYLIQGIHALKNGDIFEYECYMSMVLGIFYDIDPSIIDDFMDPLM